MYNAYNYKAASNKRQAAARPRRLSSSQGSQAAKLMSAPASQSGRAARVEAYVPSALLLGVTPGAE